MSDKGKAEDLVHEAQDLLSAKANIKKALALNPDRIEAYEFLGSTSTDIGKTLKYYIKAAEIGKRLFGGEYLKENKGHFWGLHETRPYMRSLFQAAVISYIIDNIDATIVILEDLIELNPSDDQGVRDYLLLYLIEDNQFEKYKKYAKMFKDDGLVANYFNKTLFCVKMKVKH